MLTQHCGLVLTSFNHIDLVYRTGPVLLEPVLDARQVELMPARQPHYLLARLKI